MQRNSRLFCCAPVIRHDPKMYLAVQWPRQEPQQPNFLPSGLLQIPTIGLWVAMRAAVGFARSWDPAEALVSRADWQCICMEGLWKIGGKSAAVNSTGMGSIEDRRRGAP